MTFDRVDVLFRDVGLIVESQVGAFLFSFASLLVATSLLAFLERSKMEIEELDPSFGCSVPLMRV